MRGGNVSKVYIYVLTRYKDGQKQFVQLCSREISWTTNIDHSVAFISRDYAIKFARQLGIGCRVEKMEEQGT